jgi:uncharacterized protein YcfJ
MVRRLAGLGLGVVVLMSGCVSVPTGPSVIVLPGTAKAFDQFVADDGTCRQFAVQQTGPAQDAQVQSGVTTAAIGTVVGAALGAAIGAAAGNPALGAAIGAGSGLFGGSVVGADAAEVSRLSTQQRYDGAYVQCMYAKGHQVPVRRESQAAYRAEPARARTTAQTPPPPPPSVPLPPPGAPPPPPPGPAR